MNSCIKNILLISLFSSFLFILSSDSISSFLQEEEQIEISTLGGENEDTTEKESGEYYGLFSESLAYLICCNQPLLNNCFNKPGNDYFDSTSFKDISTPPPRV